MKKMAMPVWRWWVKEYSQEMFIGAAFLALAIPFIKFFFG